MTKEQRERLKQLDEQPSKTIEEMRELSGLLRDFYKYYGQAIHDFENRVIHNRPKISDEKRAKRAPLKPEILMNAKQDRVHTD